MSDLRRFWWVLPPVLFAVLTALIVNFWGGPSDPPAAEDDAEQTFATSASPAVNIDSLGGDIRISVHDRNEVTVRVHRQGLGESESEAFDNLARLAVRMGQDGDTVSARAFDDPTGATPGDLLATFDVVVPRGASLSIQTGGGRIEVAGVAGPISAVTGRGAIEIVLPHDSSFRVAARSAEFTTNFPMLVDDSGDPEIIAGHVGAGSRLLETTAPGGSVIVRYE